MYYDPLNDQDVYQVLTSSLTDSVFKSFYCSCCRACDSKSSACIFPVPKPIVLDQEWIVLSYHLSTNAFLSYEAFSNLIIIGKERMLSLYPKGVTLFHEGSLQPYHHPNAYLTSDLSFPLTPCPYTEIHKIYTLYSILASYASLTNHTVVWQCRWTSSLPQVQFRLVDLDKASKERAFYSLNISIHTAENKREQGIQNGVKDSGKKLFGLVSIPDDVFESEILIPDSLDITHWNKLQTQTRQRELVDHLRSLREMTFSSNLEEVKVTSQTIYLLGLYSLKLLQGGYPLTQLKQDIEYLKWPLLIRSKGLKKKGQNVPS